MAITENELFSKLTNETELFGLFGAGYPTSLYKAFVRLTPNGQWYKVESDVGEAEDPIAYQATLPMSVRQGCLWAPLRLLNNYGVADKPALAALKERVASLTH
jgi:hypothetical protein